MWSVLACMHVRPSASSAEQFTLATNYRTTMMSPSVRDGVLELYAAHAVLMYSELLNTSASSKRLCISTNEIIDEYYNMPFDRCDKRWSCAIAVNHCGSMWKRISTNCTFRSFVCEYFPQRLITIEKQLNRSRCWLDCELRTDVWACECGLEIDVWFTKDKTSSIMCPHNLVRFSTNIRH